MQKVGRPKKVFEPKRLIFDEKKHRFQLNLPKSLYRNLSDFVAENNPEPYYNKTHFIICSIIEKLRKEKSL